MPAEVESADGIPEEAVTICIGSSSDSPVAGTGDVGALEGAGAVAPVHEPAELHHFDEQTLRTFATEEDKEERNCCRQNV